MNLVIPTTQSVSPELLERARVAFACRNSLALVSGVFTADQLKRLLYKRLEQRGFTSSDIIALPYYFNDDDSEPVHFSFRLAGVIDTNLMFHAELDPETGRLTSLTMSYAGHDQGDIDDLADIYEMLAAIDTLDKFPQ